MWPFKKSRAEPPAPFSRGDMTARYHEVLKVWEFSLDAVDFNIAGLPFNEAAFDWAREAIPTIRKLNEEIRAKVMDYLEDSPCDKTKAKMLVVDLDDYGTSKTIMIAFTGDESWGDYGIDVIIEDGKIVDVSGGD
jgi:hypothetical protein